MKIQVFLAHIHHERGANLYAAASKKALYVKLADFCREYWSDFKDGDAPEDNDACVAEYFHENDSEWLDTDSDEIEVPA